MPRRATPDLRHLPPLRRSHECKHEVLLSGGDPAVSSATIIAATCSWKGLSITDQRGRRGRGPGSRAR
jgi:hypothetical protein